MGLNSSALNLVSAFVLLELRFSPSSSLLSSSSTEVSVLRGGVGFLIKQTRNLTANNPNTDVTMETVSGVTRDSIADMEECCWGETGHELSETALGEVEEEKEEEVEEEAASPWGTVGTLQTCREHHRRRAPAACVLLRHVCPVAAAGHAG